MLFRRRSPLPFLLRLREFVWPRAGWRRTLKYLWHRLARLPGTTGSIAAGFACGAAVSFLPLIGLHFVLAALLAWLLRGNVLASALGTVVGNPWTFPAIWVGTYWLGRFILGYGDDPTAQVIDFRAVFQSLWYGIEHLDGAHLAEHVWPVWWPMFVGSVPVAVAMWFAFYWPLKRAITSYHHVRGLRRLERLAARAKVLQAAEQPGRPALKEKKD